MALILKDRVKETTTVVGTGTATLLGAVTGYQSFAAIGNGNTCYYTIAAQVANEWEVGIGTYTSSGTTLSRDTVLSSSNGGALVNFSAGTKDVFVTQPSSKAVYTDASNIVNTSGNAATTVTFTQVNTTNLVANTVTITAGTITTNATNNTDITNKAYVDGIAATGLTYHTAVQVATTQSLAAQTGGTVTYNQPGGAGNGVGATITLSVALNTLDGYSLSNTNRILVKDETNQTYNGIYTWATGGTVLTRATDADTYGSQPNQLSLNDYFYVQNGNVNKGSAWVVDSPTGTITFGTSNIAFAQFSSSQVYSAGTGLSLTNTTFSISNTAVTAATYGDDGNVAQFTVNAQGQLTNAANVAINASSITVGTLNNARTTAASANGASTIVARDTNGSFSANVISASNVSSSVFNGTGTLNLVGGTSSTTSLGTNATTGTTTIGGTSQTGTITVGRSTANSTTNIQSGATLSGNTKTINLGTSGVSGSTTLINIGDANGTTVTVSGTTNLSNVNVSGNVSVGGSISGNGGALTAINASNISSGTIANARTTAASANGASTIVQRDSGGNFSANTVTAAVIGDLSGGTNINASNISSGTIANARTTASSSNGASTIVLRDAGGAFAAGAITGSFFIGDGSNVSAINASNISTGTIDNARTTASSANGASTIVARDAGGNFSANTITATTFSGAFSGNGATLTDINASNITSGTISNARTTAASANGASTIVARDTNGSFSANIATLNLLSSGVTSFSLANGTATTINFAGAATTLNQAVSTANVTHNYSTGATLSGNTKTINLGINGVSGSTTNVNIGSANGTTVTISGTTNLTNVNVSGAITGNGSGISAINASNISSGTIDNARTTASSSNGANTIVLRSASGNFAANEISGEEMIATNGLFVNNRTIATSYSIPAGYSASSTGPVSLSNGVSVTVPSGGKWVVL